jgi:hypothetical protein
MSILRHLIVFVALLPASAVASIGITDILVRNSSFSPNGDGVLDSTEVIFNLSCDTETAYVWISVKDGDGQMIISLADGEPTAPGKVGRVWDGTGSSGHTAPEGEYTFEITASADADTTPTYMAKALLDVTAPAFGVLITPNPYAPNIPLADTLVKVDVSVLSSRPGDRLTIVVGDGEEPDSICTRELAEGDSIYTCFWDGRDMPDGIYALEVATSDIAGNGNIGSYSIDLDLEGPTLRFTHPERAHLSWFPDSVIGRAYDRNGVEAPVLRFLDGTAFTPLLTRPSGDSLVWYIGWPESLSYEGRFELECHAGDGLGHQSIKTFGVVVDTTPPGVPSLSPLPGTVSDPRLSVSGTGSADDSVLIYVNQAVAARTVCSATGQFKSAVELEMGVSTIYAIGRDKAGNVSGQSETVMVEYAEPIGIHVPERLGPDSSIEINLSKPGARITLRIFALDGTYIGSVVVDRPDLYGEISWDLTDSDGQSVKNGVYLLVFDIRYEDGTGSVEKRMVVVAR